MELSEMRKSPHLSASSVGEYVECGLLYKFAKIDKIPWEFIDLELYYRRNKSNWPLIIQQIALASSPSAVVFYTPQTDYYSGILGIGTGGTEEVYETTAAGKGGKHSLIMTSTNNLVGLSFGYLPWHCYQFPMGMKDDIEDWYDPAGKKPILRLRAGGQGTSGTGQVVLEELVKY